MLLSLICVGKTAKALTGVKAQAVRQSGIYLAPQALQDVVFVLPCYGSKVRRRDRAVDAWCSYEVCVLNARMYLQLS